MHIFKKSIHIFSIILISAILGFLLLKLLYPIIGIDLNNFIIYNDNYNNTSGKIVIVKLDNKSLDSLQKSDIKVLNIQKTVFANTIEKLEKLGVKAIGIDVVFANLSDDVDVLKKTIEKYNNIIIAAKLGEKGNEENDRVLPLEVFPKKIWGAIDMKILKNAANRINPLYDFEGEGIEALGIKVYRKYVQDKLEIGTKIKGYYSINPLKKIPLNNDGDNLIRFFNKPGDYKSFSLIDILNDKIPKQELENKIVLIGEYGTLIHDSYFSPLDPVNKMPGVEFHANFIDSILQNKYLVEQSENSQNLYILLILIFFGAVYFLLSLRKSLAIFIVYFVFFTFLGRYLLTSDGLVINLFAYFIYGFITFIVTYSYKFFIVDRNKRYIEHAFSHYLSKEIVEKIAEDVNSLKLGGEKRKVTIFFSDIAGFTTISEKLGTDKIFNLLGEYLSEMTDILIRNKGTLDKYIGDAVMGFFNAPITIANPEYMACTTAIEQQKKLIELNEKWKDTYPSISARIGINTGEAMVGNIGSKDRFNYTVIGDHVNLASRLEGVNKEYLTKICVSEDTYLVVKDKFIFRELDTIKVKGKLKGVKIYELVGYLGDDNINLVRLNNYETGLNLYYQGKYKEAKKIFEENIGDLPSAKMILRCQDAINGKIEVINGVYELKNK